MKLSKTKKTTLQIEDLSCIKELSDLEAQAIAGGAYANKGIYKTNANAGIDLAGEYSDAANTQTKNYQAQKALSELKLAQSLVLKGFTNAQSLRV